MKKTLATLAMASGLLATAQAEITKSWTAEELTSSAGTITVPANATTGQSYGDFTLTAVLNVDKVTEKLNANGWGVVMGFTSAVDTNSGYGYTLNGSSSASTGGIWAERTTNGTFDTTGNRTMGDDISTDLRGLLTAEGANYTSLALTMSISSGGWYGYMTLVDDSGNKTEAGGLITSKLKDDDFGRLGSITYDAAIVEYLTLDNTLTNTATAGYAANAAAIAASVPEPATATLSLLALAGLAARRRRK